MQEYLHEEERIIEENAAYVLGMYDLYPNDHNIINALHAKGLNGNLIMQIIHRVKLPAYEKRLKQAKRNIVIGSILFTILTSVYFFFTSLPGAETVLNDSGRGEKVFIIMFKFYREIFYFVFFIAILQMCSGILSYRKYTRLLQYGI